MELFDVIKKRLSFRGTFSSDVVSREDLRKIVEAGLKAPSGKNVQTTEFVIVDDSVIVSRIQNLHCNNKAMQTARAYIVCIVDAEPEAIYEGYSFQVEDCAAAVENMLLAITALGYSSVWIDGWLRLNNHAETIGEMIEVPAGKVIRVVLPVGVPAEDYRQPVKKPFEKRAWFNCYSRSKA